MPNEIDQAASRRKFLQFIAASPVLGYADKLAFAETLLPKSKLPDPMIWAPLDPANLIKSPKEAINVFDFEPVMRQNVPPAHFGYMASGIDDEVTLRANREGFLKFQLRPRRLVDVSKVDMSTDILGVKYASPIIIAPTGGHKAYHLDGEEGVAKAAKAGNHLMILSTQTSTGVEDVDQGARRSDLDAALRHQQVRGRGAPRQARRECRLHRRSPSPSTAPAAATRRPCSGCTRTDTRECSSCHDRTSIATDQGLKPMYEGVDLTGLRNIQSSTMSWDYLKRLRDMTKMKVVIKGLLAWEDAKLAADAGYDAIIVSNHGARSEDSGRSTIDALPEIVEAVNGRMPILIDSGFRRGTDICKALCMGATGVAVGRPYLWALGAFGEPGVERMLELLRLELLGDHAAGRRAVDQGS